MARIILACDFSSFTEHEQKLLESMTEYVDLFKIGLESETAINPETSRSVGSHMREFIVEVLDKGFFWDLKLKDIRNTVHEATRHILDSGARMFTIHADNSDETLADIAQACRGTGVLPVAVTVLTDLTREQCITRYGSTPKETTRRLARNAYSCGIGAIVCSAHELYHVRTDRGMQDLITVVPGIRPVDQDANDQERVATPEEAATEGANYLVIGRSIMTAPDPVEAAKEIFNKVKDID